MARKRGTVFDLDLGERIGKTPTEWLRWILGFAQTDLGRLRPEERIALARDLAIFPGITRQAFPLLGVTRAQKDGAPVPDKSLRAIRDELGRMFRELLTGSGSWLVPGLKRVKILRITPKDCPLTGFLTFWDAAGDTRAAVLGAVVGLLVKYGHKVRACPECRKVFVATRRQEYCDTRCSQRVRNQRRKEGPEPAVVR